MAKIRIDTIKNHTWPRTPQGKVTKHNKHNTQESQEASPFPAGDHKAAMNRQESMTNINDTQKKHRLGTLSKTILLGA